MSGAKHRRKGDRIEREIVALHQDMGIHAERVPLSGAQQYQGNGADVDIYPWGLDAQVLVSEVKGRKDGDGFKTLEKWLGENDILFLRRNNAEPLVVLPWQTWARMLRK